VVYGDYEGNSVNYDSLELFHEYNISNRK